MKPSAVSAFSQASFLMLSVGLSTATARAQERPDPMVAPEGMTQLSEHVYSDPRQQRRPRPPTWVSSSGAGRPS